MKKKTKGGDCYQAACQFALGNIQPDMPFGGTPYVVHAEVRGQGAIEGLRYGHAWVEDDNFVYDYSNGRTLVIPKVLYYHYGDVRTNNPKKYRRYTFDEARMKMYDTGHYGHWDLDVLYADGGITNKYHLGGDMSKHLAPNGKPSNLTHEQWHLVRTPAFKAWFGDFEEAYRTGNYDGVSKVVDSNGEPMVVWHTTDKDFTIFDIKKSKKGFFFSPQQQRLVVYNKKHIGSYFLNLKNPSHEIFKHDMKYLLSKGYDGIMDYGHAKHLGNENLYEIIAFKPTQIKLADGSNTTFDGSNPDIRYAEGGKIKIKVHSEEGEEDRTTISIPNVGEAVLAETTPEYEFMEDIDEKTMKRLGVEEGDLIGKLEWIEIKDEYKGQGYATILMKKVIEVAKEKDLMPLYLNASPMGFTGLNTEKLTAFYEKFGFKVFKRQGHNNLMLLKDSSYAHGGLIHSLKRILPTRILKASDIPF